MLLDSAWVRPAAGYGRMTNHAARIIVRAKMAQRTRLKHGRSAGEKGGGSAGGVPLPVGINKNDGGHRPTSNDKPAVPSVVLKGDRAAAQHAVLCRLNRN